MKKSDIKLLNQTRAELAWMTGVLDKVLHDGIGLNDAKFIRQYVRDGLRAEKRFHRWIESSIAAQVKKTVAKPPLATAVAEAPVPYVNKRMQSKFKSTCVTCGQPIAKGEEIIYRKGLGAKHYSCFAQEPLPNGGREDCHGSGEDYPCSDLGYEDACAAACGL